MRIEKGGKIKTHGLSIEIDDHFTGWITCYREYLIKSNYRISRYLRYVIDFVGILIFRERNIFSN